MRTGSTTLMRNGSAQLLRCSMIPILQQMYTDPLPPTPETDKRTDQADLGRFGYAQELFRNMGGFSNFAISFSIISILTGAVTLYG